MKHNMPAIDPAEPQVMAILNVTPDSFYAGSRTPDGDAVARRVREALDEGASIIDVGGYSSRPGADEVSPDTCRLWDATTNERLDKDRFRRDLGRIREAYEEILARLTKITE